MNNLLTSNDITLPLENCVIGGILIDRDAISEVTFLIPECFNDTSNAEIFAACKEMYNLNEPIDLVTVTNKLWKEKRLTAELTPYYITTRTNYIASTAHIKFHGIKLVEYYVERELMKVGMNLTEEIKWDDAIEVYNNSDNKIRELIQSINSQAYETATEGINKALKELQTDSETGLTGIPSGFINLDRITGGFQKTDLIVLAARPGMGKTALMLTIARNAAIEFNHPVGVFSHEMSNPQLIKRFISVECELPLDRIMRNQASGSWQEVFNKLGRINTDKILIDESAAGNFVDLKTKIKRLQKERGIELVFVDYMQMMKSTSWGKNQTRDQEMGDIANGLKVVAKELKIPIVALSQLSRNTEGRADKRPLLSDLRDSGNIEQAADIVIFLYRPEYYQIDQDADGNSTKGYTELIIAKNRNGICDTVPVTFLPQFTKFVNYEGEPLVKTSKSRF